MKILHVAVFKPESTNVCQAEGFEHFGHHVYRFDYRRVATELGSNLKRDDRLIEVCQSYKPDIILFSKCNKMDSIVIDACNKVGKTVLWFMDNFHSLDGELREKMKKVDHVVCTTRKSVDVAKSLGADAHRLTGGFDPKIHKPLGLHQFRKATFIGNTHPYRKPYLREVTEIVQHTNVHNEAHCKLVNESCININFTEGDGVSNRIYKIMGAGGFLLTNKWNEMEEDFNAGVELVTFDTAQELKDKIKYYLENKKVRDKIALAGCVKARQRDNINYARRILEICS